MSKTLETAERKGFKTDLKWLVYENNSFTGNVVYKSGKEDSLTPEELRNKYIKLDDSEADLPSFNVSKSNPSEQNVVDKVTDEEAVEICEETYTYEVRHFKKDVLAFLMEFENKDEAVSFYKSRKTDYPNDEIKLISSHNIKQQINVDD